ncbi:universal stress protein [Sediminicola sp. 1XM1-17]|uniref:universal stress protein n=1 Tax=Sediminicola sp. 1XM1-17 TaxID=3127702 RepID=UPI003076A4AF
MNSTPTNYSILVFIDFSETSIIALKNAAKLVKSVNGNIQAHYVEPLRRTAEEENQLTFKRRLTQSLKQSNAKAQKIIAPIAEEEGVEINFTMDWGNIKDSILKKVKDTDPDLVILGRRKAKMLDFIGDKLTQFVVDQLDTNVLISGSHHELHSFSDLYLGFYGETLEKSEFKIIDHLQESNRSIKYFGIRNKMPEHSTGQRDQENNSSFIFPQDGTNAIEALTSYVVRTNTQLFCIPKNNNLELQPVKEMVHRLDIPILLYK